jgi:hypothetical protein
MTTKILSGTYSNYVLAAAYSGVSITSTGLLEGSAGVNNGGKGGIALWLFSGATASVANSGRIVGGNGGQGHNPGGSGGAGGPGVRFDHLAILTNLGTIDGGRGGNGGDDFSYPGWGGDGGNAVSCAAAGQISNYGTIVGGDGGGGGSTDNPYATGGGGGNGGDGISLPSGTVINFGLIQGGRGGSGGQSGYRVGHAHDGIGGNGVTLSSGNVVNGDPLHTGAIIGGRYAVSLGSGTITNYGTLIGGADVQNGVVLNRGLIENELKFSQGLVVNKGTLDAAFSRSSYAATLVNYGSCGYVRFYSPQDTIVAEGGSVFDEPIRGGGIASGVSQLQLLAGAPGTINGMNGFAVTMAYGASWILQGDNILITKFTLPADSTIKVTGTVDTSKGRLTNLNAGTLTGGTFDIGPRGKLQVQNNAPITELNAAVALEGPGSIVESFDTITRSEVSLELSLTSIGAPGRLILGGGLTWSSSQTITNAGEIGLTGGTFTAAGLISSGAIEGYGVITAPLTSTGYIAVAIGALTLEGATNILGGSLTNLATVNQMGVVTLGGSGEITNQTGSTWNLGNGILLGAASTGGFVNDGLLVRTATGAISNVHVDFASTGTVQIASGTLAFEGAVNSFAGTVTGAGTLSLAGGATTLGPGLSLGVGAIAISGAATTVVLDENLSWSKLWTQTSASVSVASGDTLTLTGAADTLGGTVTGAGSVAIAGGSDTLSAVTLSAAHMQISKAAVTLQGGITLVGVLTDSSPSVTIAAAGAVLEGGGTLALTNSATNAITGANATALLNNAHDRIQGSGQLGDGQMALANGLGGAIIGNGSVALIINTGGQTISNAGLIEDSGTGGTTIVSAISNAGVLEALHGTLTVESAVTGTGRVVIGSGGVADFAAAFSQNVAFAAGGGTLELAKSQGFAGVISGFSKTGTTTLDLGDIAFGGATKATYSGTKTSGVLTVTDGTHTANIKLTGNYLTSTWNLASDGHGGTTVVDPQPATAAALTGQMAGFAAAPPMTSGSAASSITSRPIVEVAASG